MYHDFGGGGSQQSAVGEVFGTKHWQWSFAAGIPIVVQQQAGAGGAASFKFTGGVTNVGDAPSPSVTGKLVYIRGRVRRVLASFKLAQIAPGASRRFVIEISPRLGVPPGPCVLRIELPPSRREFTTRDNNAELRVTLRLA
jgi:hypothetical protein